MKKLLSILMATTMVASPFIGHVEKVSAESAETAASGEALTFGVAHCVLGEDYWEACIVGMQKAADELGIELIVQGAQNDPAKQVEQIENFISQDVDAIICSPVDVEAIQTSVKKCNDAEIPFIFASRITESIGEAMVDSGVGFDVKEMSKAGAEWLVEYAKANDMKFNVLEVMGALSDSHSIGCRDGLAEVTAANPDYLSVQQIPTDWDVSKALSGTLSALQADDSINCIYYHSDAMFAAVQSALMQTNKYVKNGEEGHIVLLACGGTKDTLDAMKEGYVDALEVTPIVEVGYESVYQAKKYIDGEIQRGESLLYDAYVLDATNFDEKANDVFGYAK